MTEMLQVSSVRTAATWLRKTGRTIDEYPRREHLDSRMRQEAQQFACGILPWPSRWTIKLYELATAG